MVSQITARQRTMSDFFIAIYFLIRKSICVKNFSHQSGTNSEQAAAINAALVTELEMDAKPASMITTKNRACEFFIQKAILKTLKPITCMGNLGLNSSKLIQFLTVITNMLNSYVYNMPSP
jgi:hypothetical protein